MGCGIHGSKIDGFPGTHGFHANGATDLIGGQKLTVRAVSLDKGAARHTAAI